eukprot:scaffold50559_cov35-Prasinocladus_malaysianus.AAC.1
MFDDRVESTSTSGSILGRTRYKDGDKAHVREQNAIVEATGVFHQDVVEIDVSVHEAPTMHFGTGLQHGPDDLPCVVLGE